MKALIFGANGQDGHYLKLLCIEKGIEPICVSRYGFENIGDVSRLQDVDYYISHHKPHYIFHLAANSTTNHDSLFENHYTISTGTLNILETVKTKCPNTKVFITGSAVQFKNNLKPISELAEFEASSPYSIARIQSVYAARYFRTLGLKVYVGYLFHHESPFRKPNHVSKKIAWAAQRIARGSNEKLELGDISVEKEWTFAGDVVKAMFTLVNQDEIFEAVIGSGYTYSIEDWLIECFALINKNWKEHVTLRTDFEAEYKKLVSNPHLINSLGWAPLLSFKELAKMMVFTDLD